MGDRSKRILVNILVIAGILIAYIHQMSPSPFLPVLRDAYQIIDNDAFLNLSVSIMYPFLIIASIFGGVIEANIGLWKLFILSMALMLTGIALYFISTPSYFYFLMGRALFATGMGLSIPFFGAYIMQYFYGRKREIMNMLNALFPFIGTLISFASFPLLYNLFKKSWEMALGVWSLTIVAVLIIWLLCVHSSDFISDPLPIADYTEMPETGPEKRIYHNLLRRRDLILLTVIFMVDFFCYSYIAVILPTLLMEAANWTETVAGFWSALAFPGIGIVGCIIGGALGSGTGKRKFVLIMGMLLESIGIFIAAIGGMVRFDYILIGIALFGLGNGLWLPMMYNIPMELKDMNPSRVGAAFSMISAAGFICGFISPAIGGWLTDFLSVRSIVIDLTLRHVQSLNWSLFVFGFITFIGVICAFLISETGPGKSVAVRAQVV